MVTELSFGIGCFHFGVKRIPPFKFKGSEYIKELNKALESIPNIDKIDISWEEDFKNVSIDVENELPNIHDNLDFFPRPVFFNIEFEIYLPFRVQEKLSGKFFFLGETFTERFKILIYYRYNLPVAFIEPIKPKKRSVPSSAVAIARKFLENEFEKSKTDYIRFEFLGPSPLHADCYIQPQEIQDDSDEGMKCQYTHIQKRGYDKIIFAYNQKIFREIEEAREWILNEISDELSFYYKLVQERNMRMHDWGDIDEIVSQIVQLESLAGLGSSLKRLIKRRKLVNRAFTSLIDFDGDRLLSLSVNRSSYESLYSGEEENYLQYFIDKEMKPAYEYPSSEWRKLISFYENRGIRSFEALIVFVSALLGAIIGALSILAFSK